MLLRSFSPKLGHRDSWAWIKEGSGLYGVKSASKFLQGDPEFVDGNLYNKLWRVKAPSGTIALTLRIFLNREKQSAH